MAADIQNLPVSLTRNGEPRRVGIEVEFGGLTEREVAMLASSTLGGTPRQKGAFEWMIADTRIGAIEVLFDTVLRDKAHSQIAKAGLNLGRAVIPVEMVTEPLAPDLITEVEQFCRVLVSHGAVGTRDGLALGFGVHFNIALAGSEIDDILPTVRAFALSEDWMRGAMNLDTSRRILPFIDPYPARLVDALCDVSGEWTVERLASAYLHHSPTRNRGLDLLPILKEFDADRVESAVPNMAHKTGRLAWHYRLPDCRLDEEDWSVGLEWNRWCGIERLANDTDRLDALMDLWREHRRRIVSLPGRWAVVSAPMLESAGIVT